MRYTSIFISIQPQRPGWQEPEPSNVTGMAVAHCILGKFVGVVCHCFPPDMYVLYLHVHYLCKVSEYNI